MKINIVALKKLILEKFRNNQSWFADEIGVNVSFLNEIINGRKGADSNKLCTAIILFCENNNLNFRDYIFLDNSVQKNEQDKTN